MISALPMRGGSQAKLLLCDDRRWYVSKFPNNPQHVQILANELICCQLAEYLWLPTAHGTIIEVSEEVVRTQGLQFETCGRWQTCEPGQWFGSEYPGSPVNPHPTITYDYVPDSLLGKVANLRDFWGWLVFDQWVANADGRQAIFLPPRRRVSVPGNRPWVRLLRPAMEVRRCGSPRRLPAFPLRLGGSDRPRRSGPVD